VLRSDHVLVVEDDPEMAEIIHVNLVAAGIPATSVPDGIQALRALDEVRPTLVTMDLNVPEVSGFRLLYLFKKFAPNLPVIVVTGFEFEEAEEIAHSGADDFVTKPFDPVRLVARIRDMLDRSAAKVARGNSHARPTAPVARPGVV
jgi:DNA-binding response OmpR family regulator